jgi:hypothetical protein
MTPEYKHSIIKSIRSLNKGAGMQIAYLQEKVAKLSQLASIEISEDLDSDLKYIMHCNHQTVTEKYKGTFQEFFWQQQHLTENDGTHI